MFQQWKKYKIGKMEDKVSETADIKRVIAIKIDAKVMIWRNIDVTLRLINRTIGNAVAVNRSIEIVLEMVISDNKEITITKIDIKFEDFTKSLVVHWKQFLLSLSYGITIHKGQGIMCKNAMMNSKSIIRNECVQWWSSLRSLSRVNTLEDLQLINFNPASVKANSGCRI